MSGIKEQFAAGRFYPSDNVELRQQLKYFEQNHKCFYTCTSRAVIVPHAGYVYSGQLAFDGFSYLDKTVKNIFILAPTHNRTVNNLALPEFDFFATPLGNIAVNKTVINDIQSQFECEFCDDAFTNEHAIEVQLPFIQFNYSDDIKIVPILVGNDDVQKVMKIIKFYYPNKKNAFIISSDLSHFLTDEQAKKTDITTAMMIEDNDVSAFRYEQACGAVPICALTAYSAEKNFSFLRVGLTNSSIVTNDTKRVVGYGCWLLSEIPRNDFIKENFSPKVIDIVSKTIDAKLSGKSEINITSYMPYAPLFDTFAASFVTLKLNGELRGCMGSAIAHQPLIVDLIQNAYNAAFLDPRFSPITREEFDDVQISVSLLSPPAKMIFKDEEDLLKQLRVGIDGLIIRAENKQALYLPSVWEQLRDKKDFLTSLKIKAGLAPDFFSSSFEAYRFTASYIE